MKKTALAMLILAAAPLAADIHFKTEMTGAGLPAAMTGETWIKGKRVRSVMQTPMGPSTSIMKDDMMYVTMGPMAMKMSMDAANRQQRNVNPADYANRYEEFTKDGTKLGMETIDGDPCEKWKISKDGNETLLWISVKLKFPRQVVVKTEKGEVTMKYKDIEMNVSLDSKLFEPDPNVTYQDMSEMMKRAQEGQRPRN